MPNCVTVQIDEPVAGSLGTVTEGFYVVEGNKLTMTFANGEPVQIDGKTVERTLVEGDNPRRIAGRLVPQVRRALTGKSSGEEKFAASIQYPQMGYA